MKNKINSEEIDFTPWNNADCQLYKEQGLWINKTLDRIITQGEEKYTDKIAVIDANKSWTYKEINNNAKKLATGFKELGIEENDKVIVQLPNIGEYFEIIFALFKIGAIPVYALPAHRNIEIEQFCKISKAKSYIIAEKSAGFDYINLARKIKSSCALENIIVCGDAEEFISLDSLYRAPIKKAYENSTSVALLQLSGGTTNIPKLIPRTHDDYYYSVRESVKICELNVNSVFLAVLPIAHNFTHSSPGVLGALYAGSTIVLAENGSADLAFELIEKHKVTLTSLVPPLAMIWLSYAKATTKDLSSLSLIQVGGAKFSAEAAKKIKPVFKCQLQQVFGMAEGLINYTRLDDPDEIIFNTQGRPMSPYDEIKVIDKNGLEVADGFPGELLTRGPYTIKGYFRANEHNNNAFTSDGFYRTGDIVCKNKEGYIIVEGRVKDQINRGGEKVSAEEVENLLLSHASIQDVAIVAMPDKLMGERSCAFILLSNNAEKKPGIGDIRHFLENKGLAEYKLPDRIEYTNNFPMTSFGKINKQSLRSIITEKTKTAELA